MTTPRWSPGPWQTGSCDGWIVLAPRFRSTDWKSDPDHTEVCVADVQAPAWARVKCDKKTREAWLAESTANARLIAAAPTMAAYIKTKADAGDAEAVAIWEAINAHS